MTDNRAPDPVTDVWELLWTAACDYRGAAGPDRSEARLVDALMPIVRAYGAGQLDGVAEELLGFGDTAPSKQNVQLAAWLQATADNLRTGAAS